MLRAVLSPLSKTSRAVVLGSTLFSVAFGLNIIQTLTLALAPFSQRLTIKVNSMVVGAIWMYMQILFELVGRAKVTFSGDLVPCNENAVVLSNHRGFADFYLVHALAARRKMLSSCKYFAKDSLKWIPFFGWGLWLANFVLLKRNWVDDQSKLKEAFLNITKYRTPVWIISFLEGTRITPQKQAESVVFARARNLPLLRNILLPRTKGFLATIRGLRGSHVKHVYDLTIAYKHVTRGFGVAPNIVRVHTAPLDSEYKFHVHVRRISIDSLPNDDDNLSQWVKQLYVEKDDYLEKLKNDWDGQIQQEQRDYGELI